MRVITQLAEDGKTADAVRIQLENLQRKSTGLTREILLTRYYLLLLRSLQLNVFDAVFTKESVRHPYLLNEIQTARVQLQTYLLNKETKGASLESFKTNTTVGLIDSIAAGCNGKVVYIDFWAPWCTPCMDEMPHSKALQEYYKEKDVVFIYLAVSCSDEAWRATIANKKLGGRHFLLTDDQYKVLSAQFGIAGIPHYVMIDKKGNIAQKYAPRPSEREILLRTVDELLNN